MYFWSHSYWKATRVYASTMTFSRFFDEVWWTFRINLNNIFIPLWYIYIFMSKIIVTNGQGTHSRRPWVTYVREIRVHHRALGNLEFTQQKKLILKIFSVKIYGWMFEEQLLYNKMKNYFFIFFYIFTNLYFLPFQKEVYWVYFSL